MLAELEQSKREELMQKFSQKPNAFIGIEKTGNECAFVCIGEGAEIIEALSVAMTAKPHFKMMVLSALAESISI
jgi:hypothetical protein